jgi:hypothetical protein
MEDFERILKSYMPFVIIGSMWNMLPDLVNAFSELGKRQLTEKGREPTEEKSGSPRESWCQGMKTLPLRPNRGGFPRRGHRTHPESEKEG